MSAIEKLGRFVDPIIGAHRRGEVLTPNGNHRLAALRHGARSVVALVVPEQAAHRF
jgi:hypothetical protein